jgi:poly(3-hydroxyalkanoate) synthetase
VERHLEMIQKHTGKLNDDEKKKESERLMKVLDKARAMSDKDFELNGPDLAKEFITESKKTLEKDKELQKEAEKIRQERHGGPSRLGRFLINPKIVPILEKRLELMKNAKQLPPADLDNIKTR